ncbi:MAG: hypothetical protein GF353_00145 [Candidatus Lokiarchaeota archaeon]|nr:hypothetical protein [Candidatus Lokiarchaeota archaeon]
MNELTGTEYPGPKKKKIKINYNTTGEGYVSYLRADFEKSSDTSSLNIEMWNATINFNNVIKENRLLKFVIKNLWKNHKYNQEYASFLLNLYSKEEFMKIAKSFAEPLNNNISKDDIVIIAKAVISIIDEPITSGDLSIMLNTDCSKIDKYLKQPENGSDNALIGKIHNEIE